MLLLDPSSALVLALHEVHHAGELALVGLERTLALNALVSTLFSFLCCIRRRNDALQKYHCIQLKEFPPVVSGHWLAEILSM